MLSTSISHSFGFGGVQNHPGASPRALIIAERGKYPDWQIKALIWTLKKKSRLRRRLQKLCCNFKKYKWNNPQTTRWPQNVAVRNKTACLYFWHQEKLKSRRKTMRPEYKSTCFCTLLEKERLCWVDFKGAFHNKRTILTLIPRQSLGGGEAGLPTWERWTFQ